MPLDVKSLLVVVFLAELLPLNHGESIQVIITGINLKEGVKSSVVLALEMLNFTFFKYVNITAGPFGFSYTHNGMYRECMWLHVVAYGPKWLHVIHVWPLVRPEVGR